MLVMNGMDVSLYEGESILTVVMVPGRVTSILGGRAMPTDDPIGDIHTETVEMANALAELSKVLLKRSVYLRELSEEIPAPVVAGSQSPDFRDLNPGAGGSAGVM